MTVAFEQIGAGQVGRLVYQVMGKDGPIFNPSNIRYLSPDEAAHAGLAASKGADLVGLAAGLAGVNLLVSMGTLALSTAILREVKEISSKIDSLRTMSIEALRRLDSISERLNIIDIKVSENNLRHALNHIAASCIKDNTIDLVELKKLEGDLDNFMESVDGWGYGSHARFRLSSDVRDKLTGLHSFLFKIRETVAKRHNVRAGGDPYRMLLMHPISDYMPTCLMYSGCLRSPVVIMALDNDLQDHASTIANSVFDMFTFAEEKDREQVFKLVMEFSDRIWKRFMEIDHPSGYMYNGLYKLVEGNPDELDNPKKLELLSDWENHWLTNTDMGLVWRTDLELAALGDYRRIFTHWANVETKALGSDQLLVDCTWKRAS